MLPSNVSWQKIHNIYLVWKIPYFECISGTEKKEHRLKLLYKYVSSMSFDSENKSFIEFTPLGFQTG